MVLDRLAKIAISLKFTLFRSNISNLSLILGDVEISKDAEIGPFCFFKSTGQGKIVVGSGVEIGRFCKFFALRGSNIELNEQVVIEDNCHIMGYQSSDIQIEEKSEILTGTVIAPQEGKAFSGDMKIGKGCVVHENNIFDLSDDISMQEKAKTGRGTIIHTHNHGIDGKESIWENPVVTEPVKIGRGAWIGTRAQIMPGSELGEGSVLGAGGILTQNTEDYVVVAGVPAEKRKERKIKKQTS